MMRYVLCFLLPICAGCVQEDPEPNPAWMRDSLAVRTETTLNTIIDSPGCIVYRASYPSTEYGMLYTWTSAPDTLFIVQRPEGE